MLTQEDHDQAFGKRQRKRRKSYTFVFRTQKKAGRFNRKDLQAIAFGEMLWEVNLNSLKG